ncbi:MAG: NifU family protein [Candidatus Paceibacterota bacterium]|jgi:Fe-S cluster biogenesis protein NfuA
MNRTKGNLIEKKVNNILAKVRPYIQMHGGDVFLVGVKMGVVTLKISGACAHCRMADLTYNNMVSGILKEDIPEIKEIIIEK